MGKNICPNCGGPLVAEALGTYGTIHQIRQDGTVGQKLRTVKYEHTGEWLYYCLECGKNYDENYFKSCVEGSEL